MQKWETNTFTHINLKSQKPNYLSLRDVEMKGGW